MEKEAGTGQPEERMHVTGYRELLAIIMALLALTGITVAVSYVHLGFFNVPIALFVASIKSSLVLLFFMHLKYEGRAIKISLLSTIAFLFVMISFIFWDVAFR
ncbi:MAG: cytochrome C oxidase subunit IV family protein [Desulfocapsaceae bacterium]|nr:cytochrome C oxidase subunit IV family protein [Desulfocapsaceae bacterium]